MSVKLITYDLNTPGQKYDDLYEAIKSLGSWWHHLDSTWLVDTAMTCDQISTKLRTVLDDNDNFLVIEVGGDRKQGWLPTKAWDWINTHW